MALDQSRLAQRFAGVKPWMALAAAISLALLAYYTVQGVWYWQALGDTSSINRELRTLDRKINSLSQTPPGASVDLEVQQAKVQALEDLFDYSTTDDLLAVVSATARDSGLELRSIRSDVPRKEVLDDLEYEVRPVAIVTEGTIANLSQFLSMLQQKIPVATAPKVRIAGLDNLPIAQVQLDFYLSPTAVPEKETDSPEVDTR